MPLVLTARFVDASPHRAKLPPRYKQLRANRCRPDLRPEREDEQMLVRPLFFTSYLIDVLPGRQRALRRRYGGAVEASSKTASALAFQLSRARASRRRLTSSRSREFAGALGVYDHVVSYEEVGELPRERVVYVDMLATPPFATRCTTAYREQLAHSASSVRRTTIGWAAPADAAGSASDVLLRARPRQQALGRLGKGWSGAATRRRLAPLSGVDRQLAAGDPWEGSEALEGAYLDLLDGRIDPAKAHVLSLPR